jgi:hypothetical protein
MGYRSVEELMVLTAGSLIEVEGRYELYSPGPGHSSGTPETARVAFANDGVLIGRFGTPEHIRPKEERERLVGKMVRVVGSFLPTAPWPHAGPPPGIWSGGGPQIAEVQSIDAID